MITIPAKPGKPRLKFFKLEKTGKGDSFRMHESRYRGEGIKLKVAKMSDDEQFEDDEYDQEDEDSASELEYDGYEGYESEMSRQSSGGVQLEALAAGTFRVMSMEEIGATIEKTVRATATLMGSPSDLDTAELLLNKAGIDWNSEKLTERFFSDSDKVKIEAGVAVPADKQESPLSEADLAGTGEDRRCMVCDDVLNAENQAAMVCNHYFCTECWGMNLNIKVSQEGQYRAQCMFPKCAASVAPSFFPKVLLPDYPEAFTKYSKFRLEHFVKSMPQLRSCPGTDCTRIVMGGMGVTSVLCECDCSFCFKCGQETHDPCTCDHLKQWLEYMEKEEGNATYLSQNTKPCPKCNERIEKNQGCNHMTCRCRFEFCWLCMKDWKVHGYQSSCNSIDREEGKKAVKEKNDTNRFLFYFTRFVAHNQSLRFATNGLKDADERAAVLEAAGMPLNQIRIVRNALTLVKECRLCLKYSYVMGHFLNKNGAKHISELFEYQQGMLESHTEQLTALTEKKCEDYSDPKAQQKLVDLSAVTKQFLSNMLAHFKDHEYIEWEASLALTDVATVVDRSGTQGSNSSKASKGKKKEKGAAKSPSRDTGGTGLFGFGSSVGRFGGGGGGGEGGAIDLT